MSNEVEEFEEFEDLSPSKKSLSFTEYFKSTLEVSYLFCRTNLSYNIKNAEFLSMPFITRKSIEINEKDMCIANLLGKEYSYRLKDKFEERFQNTIWMSYRKINEDTDMGWGCMIRVVQMVFAEVFQRYYHHDASKVAQIISLFKDEINGCLSLGNICRKGYIEKRFTSSPEIYSIVTSIMEEKKKEFSCLHLTVENYLNTISIKNEDEYLKDEFPKLISISTKVGEPNGTHFKEEYCNHLLQLMKLSNFCGMVGGVNNEALYVVGEYKELAIVLDPHYVQEEEKIETFFQKIPKGIEFTEMKSCFTLNFYFETLEDFGEWVDSLILYEKLCSPFLCFETDIKNPEEWTRNHRKESEDFEILL